MTNKEYLVFEKPFHKLAYPIMERLKLKLGQLTNETFGDVFETDHDVSRGLAFMVETKDGVEIDADKPIKQVEMILVDGCESDFEGVGLRMECSIFWSGCVWQPGNYTSDVSITTINELNGRLVNLDRNIDLVALDIVTEWNSEYFKNQNDESSWPSEKMS